MIVENITFDLNLITQFIQLTQLLNLFNYSTYSITQLTQLLKLLNLHNLLNLALNIFYYLKKMSQFTLNHICKEVYTYSIVH